MHFARVAAIVLRYLYLLRGSVSRMLSLFVWVAIDIILWGFISRYLNMISPGRLNFVPALLGAVLFWDFQVRVIHGVTTAFLEDVWARNFLNVFASPLSIVEYVTGLVFSSMVTSAVGLVVMLMLATAIFGLSFFSYGLAIVPFLLVLFLFGISLGILGSSLVMRLGPSAEWFVWPIPAMIAPFAGVFYPLSTLPGWMQAIGHILPPAYVFEDMRGIAAGRSVSLGGLGIAGALALVCVMAAGFLFTRVYRYAVRTGVLARFSAETIS